MEGSAAAAAPEAGAATQTGTPGNIVSRGKVVAATPTIASVKQDEQAAAGANAGAGGDGNNVTGAQAGAAAGANTGAAATGGADEKPFFTEEQITAMKEAGIDFDGKLDTLKQKITAPAAAAAASTTEPTAEEKAAAEAAFENRMLQTYLANGGKAEDFVATKTVVNANLKDLSDSELRRELKAEGFEDDEIKQIVKERYYQMSPEDIVKGEDEEEEAFKQRKAKLEKKIAYGSKKLEARSSHLQQQAKNIWEGLKNAVKAQDDLDKTEVAFASKVDEHAKTLPRQMTFELGEINKQKVDPVQLNVSDDAIKSITEVLKDPTKRQNFFFNPDNTLNLENVTKVMLRNAVLENALAESYKKGSTDQVKIFETKFPGLSASDIGVGGPPAGGTQTGTPGKITGRGKPEYVSRN